MNRTSVKYKAFISYSHRDSNQGDWLHKKLETFVIPKSHRMQGAGKNLYPVFRDREELPGSSDLSANIDQALANADSLIVICSPRSAKSMWVNEEVKNYQKLSPDKPIIAFLIEGDDQNPKADEYCLPAEIERLLANSQCTRIDARSAPKNTQHIAAMAAYILNNDPQQFIGLTNARSRKFRFFKAAAAASLVAVSYFIWDRVQDDKQQVAIENSNRLAAKAQDYLSSGEDKSALITAIEALSISETESNIPANPNAVSVLNQLMTKPYLKIRRLSLDAQIRSLTAVKDTPYWVINDENNRLHLYDASVHQVKWQIDDIKPLALNTSQSGSIIVRTENKLANYQLDSGLLHCEIPLDTTVESQGLNDYNWMQKGWVVESFANVSKEGAKWIYKIKFVNAKTCEATEEVLTPTMIHSISLVDVVDGTQFITVADTYEEGKAINFFNRWDNSKELKPEFLLTLQGHVKPLFQPWLHDYSWPILRTRSDRNVSYIAVQHEKDPKTYLLSQFDWVNMRAQRIAEYSFAPKKMKLLGPNNQIALIGAVPNEANEFQSEKVLSIFEESSDKAVVTHKLSEIKAGMELSSDGLSLLMEDVLGVNVQLLPGSSTLNLAFEQNNYANQGERLVGWLDNSTLLHADPAGILSTVHFNRELIPRELEGVKCCQKVLVPSAGIVLDYDKEIVQFDPHDLDFVSLYKSDATELKVSYIKNGNALLIEEERNADDSEPANAKSVALLDIASKKIVWQKDMTDISYHINGHHLYYDVGSTYDSESYHHTHLLDKQGELIQVPKGPGTVLRLSSDDKFIYDLASYSYSHTHFRKINLESKEVVNDFDVSMETSSLSKLYVTGDNQLYILHDEGDYSSRVSYLYQVNFDRDSVIKVGKLKQGYFSLKDSLHKVGKYLYLVATGNFLSGDDYYIFTPKSDEALRARDNEQLIVDEGLLERDIILVLNRNKGQLFSLNLASQTKTNIDCPASYDVRTQFIPAFGLFAVFGDSLCLVDLKTLAVMQIIEPSSDPLARSTISALIESEWGIWALGYEKATPIRIKFDWQDNLQKVRRYITEAERQAELERLGLALILDAK